MRFALAVWFAIVSALFAVEAHAQSSRPDFTGVWSGNFTTKDSDFWQIEDFTACFAGCSPTSRQHFADLLDDPANDDRSIQELWNETVGFMRSELAAKSTPEGIALQEANTLENDTVFDCKPYGLVRQALSPLPMAIREQAGHLIFDYEEWNLDRTIYMDGRDHPEDLDPTPLGYSVGRYEGDALVVDTRGLEAELYFAFQSGGGHSDQVSVIERYVVHEGPRRLVLEMTISDPVTLEEPHVLAKTWLSTPDVELVEDSCEDVPGVF